LPQYRNRMAGRNLRIAAVLLTLSVAAGCPGAVLLSATPAEAKPGAEARGNSSRLQAMYERISRLTGLPWSFVAAIERYERTLTQARPKSRPLPPEALIGIYIPENRWAGPLNPDPQDASPASIRFFGGIGQDGSGDGRADRSNDLDRLYTVARFIRSFGTGQDRFAVGLWEYYHNPRAVQRVLQFTRLLEAFGRGEALARHAFPLPPGARYSYRSTWGDGRGWGGYRIHEGTDIFAPYGVPVRSTTYGIVELKGWNKYGGWRIGIRDLDNLYHYYAHLQGFDKNLKPGDVVKPGQVIGWVGSSGYGKPGTQGKFPPHLHYGIYRDRGLVEWAFDPYPLLRRWEREEKKALRAVR